jgi:hypothetical protein
MTNQELFDKVVAHARKQGKRAVLNGRCQYRQPDGGKCFAGALIADEHYDPSLEGYGAGWPSVQNALVASGVKVEQFPLVSALQFIHDCHLVAEWPEQFTHRAAEFRLVYENNPA